MTTQTKPQSIIIIGRKWFQKTYGNTYHTATVIVDGKVVHRVPFSYGYDRMYLQNATEWLQKNGYINLEQYPSGVYQPLWQYCQDNNINLEYHAVDVSRKGDL